MTNESDALIARLRIQAVVYHHEGMQDEQVLSDAAADRIAALTAELGLARETLLDILRHRAHRTAGCALCARALSIAKRMP